MPHVPKWRRFLRFWRADVAADVDDELRFHLDEREAELRARGLTPAAARAQALAEFGDVGATREGLRAIGTRMERRRERARWRHQVVGDLRYAARGLARTPGFTAGVVLALAVGIGAAAAMYDTMRLLLLDPPAHVAEPDRVVKAYFAYQLRPDSARVIDATSYVLYDRLRARAATLGEVAVYERDVELVVGRGAGARRARATLVSGGFWRTLGTRPSLGRFIADEEAHPATGARVVVLGHAFWRRHFGGDPAAVGATLHVKGLPYTVVGVAPPGFRGAELSDTDLWLPLFASADGERAAATWHTFASSSHLRLVARPRGGVSPALVASELTREHAAVIEAAQSLFPPAMRSTTPTRVTLGPITGAAGHDGRRLPESTVSVWLTGVAVVLLAIACSNVACLLLLRALRRRREIAVRLALGVSRRRLAALLFVESGVVAALGGIAALGVIALGGAWLRRALLPGMLGDAPGISGQTLTLSAGIAIATALLTGLAPVLQARRVGVAGLRDGARHGATRRSTLYGGLLVAQTALSALLLVGAGLFLRSLHRVTTADLGFDTEHAMIVRIDFTGSGRSGGETVAFFERALARVRTIPGVTHASLATGAPFSTARGMSARTGPDAEWLRPSPLGNYVADAYFHAVGMRIARGRPFTAADRTGPPVVVVNETLARAAWPGRDPLGECLYRSSTKDRCARVVGVVRDAHTFAVREAERRPWVYAPLDPADVDDRVLLVREAPGARGIARTIARALAELDPTVPFVDVKRLADVLAPQYRPWRLGATVFTAFGVLAALLAALGLYTAVAYAVTQRTREIGVRVAVGARGGQVVGLVLGDGLRVAAVGVVAGLALALALAPWVRDLLYETSPREPAVLAAVSGALLACAGLASLGPARRAMRVPPTEALRAD